MLKIEPSPTQKIALSVKFGEGVKVYDFVNLYGCEIGDHSKIGTFVEIQKGAKIGKNCKISSHTFICEGVTIEDDVFIGHNVTFINDMYPRSTVEGGGLQTEADWVCIPTLIKKGASVGSSTGAKHTSLPAMIRSHSARVFVRTIADTRSFISGQCARSFCPGRGPLPRPVRRSSSA